MKIKIYSIFIICFLCISTQSLYSLPQHKQQNGYRTHTVSKGETLYSIAVSYNLKVQDLLDANPDAEKGIRIDDTLKIPTKGTINGADNKSYVFHSIQPKETLYSVSKLYNMSIEDILDANKDLTSENFKIGRVIKVPTVSKKAQQSTANNNNAAKTPAATNSNTNKFTTHTVIAKETLYSISGRYNISVEDLVEANPSIKTHGLQKNMTLSIPLDKVNTGNQTIAQNRTIKVGLLLPFLEKQESQKDRFVEYYEGFLLAVEELKARGFSAEVYAFDIRKGNNTKKLVSLLDTYEMKNLDMIIGGVTEDEISIISDFTQSRGIKYVVPFPIKNYSIQKDEKAFYASSPVSDLNTKAARNFCRLFKDYNIIIVSDNGSQNDKHSFISALKTDLINAGITSQTIPNTNNLEATLKAAINPSKRNIIVPSSGSLAALSKIIPALREIKEQSPELVTNLFGYPDWQAYSTQYLTDFFKFETYIYTPFYVENNDPKVQQFTEKFKNWYGKSLMNTFPKYGLLGYDTGIYFMSALGTYGKSFENNLSQIYMPGIQSAFNFEKVAGKNGYTNNGLYFVHYKPDMTIEKIDYSK